MITQLPNPSLSQPRPSLEQRLETVQRLVVSQAKSVGLLHFRYCAPPLDATRFRKTLHALEAELLAAALETPCQATALDRLQRLAHLSSPPDLSLDDLDYQVFEKIKAALDTLR